MPRCVIDPDHSAVTFAVGHMMVSTVHGLLNGVSGEFDFNPDDPASLTMTVEMAVSTLTTGVAKRDAHLHSPDFLDVARFPLIVFKCSRAMPTSLGSLRIWGDLTIRDVTREVLLDATWRGPATSDDGDTSLGITGEFSFDREDYGIDWNVPMGANGFVVGKIVQVRIDLEADLPR